MSGADCGGGKQGVVCEHLPALLTNMLQKRTVGVAREQQGNPNTGDVTVRPARWLIRRSGEWSPKPRLRLESAWPRKNEKNDLNISKMDKKCSKKNEKMAR